jgi:autophagy-related protein 5
LPHVYKLEGDNTAQWWLEATSTNFISSLFPVTMSTYGGGHPTRHHTPSAFSTPASTTLFRRLTWEGTVPLEIRVDPNELPANSDRGLECYFMQAPRVSYLPLLMPEIKKFLMDVVFDEAAASVLKEEEWWFESEEGTLLKW